MLGESDHTFSELYDAVFRNESVEGVNNVAYWSGTEMVIKKELERIKNINDLPIPKYELLEINHYSEPFMPKPFTIIQRCQRMSLSMQLLCKIIWKQINDDKT